MKLYLILVSLLIATSVAFDTQWEQSFIAMQQDAVCVENVDANVCAGLSCDEIAEVVIGQQYRLDNCGGCERVAANANAAIDGCYDASVSMECGSAAECLGQLVGKNCFSNMDKYCLEAEVELMATSVVDDTALLTHCSWSDTDQKNHMTVYVMPMIAGQVFEATLRGVNSDNTNEGDLDMYLSWGDCPLWGGEDPEYSEAGENQINDMVHTDDEPDFTGVQEQLVFTAVEDGDLYIAVRCYTFLSYNTVDGEYNAVNDAEQGEGEDWNAMYHITATCNGVAQTCYEEAGISTGNDALAGLFDAPETDGTDTGDVDHDFGWDTASQAPEFTSFKDVATDFPQLANQCEQSAELLYNSVAFVQDGAADRDFDTYSLITQVGTADDNRGEQCVMMLTCDELSHVSNRDLCAGQGGNTDTATAFHASWFVDESVYFSEEWTFNLRTNFWDQGVAYFNGHEVTRFSFDSMTKDLTFSAPVHAGLNELTVFGEFAYENPNHQVAWTVTNEFGSDVVLSQALLDSTCGN